MRIVTYLLRICGVTPLLRICGVTPLLRICGVTPLLRICGVTPCVRAWELMGTYGNFVRRAASCCVVPRVILRCCAEFFWLCCVVARRFLCFNTAFFALQGVFTLRFCAAGRFYVAILRCKAFLRCDFATFQSQSIHFLSLSARFLSRNIRMFVEPQRVCHSR